MIRAAGRIGGVRQSVVFNRADDGIWSARSMAGPMSDEQCLQRLRRILDENPPVGGTYFPEKNGVLAGYWAVMSHYFDELESLSSSYREQDFEQIPGGGDVVF
jgi:hypothetical protein